MIIQTTMNVNMRTGAVFTCVRTLAVTTPAAAMRAFTWLLTVITAKVIFTCILLCRSLLADFIFLDL